MPLTIPFSLPAGAITQFAGSAAPAGWLLMYGQAISRITYKALFDAIGTTYGAGDGSTTFNLPDARGRALFGKDDMGGSAANRLTTGGGGVNGVALGAVGGGQSVTLSAAQMPSHTHTQDAHSHVQSKTTNTAGASNPLPPTGTNNGTAANTGFNTQSATATNQNNGSSSAHANIPPALVINYIIKA